MPNIEIRGFGIGPIGLAKALIMRRRICKALAGVPGDQSDKLLAEETIIDIVPSVARTCAKGSQRAPYLRIASDSSCSEQDKVIFALSRAGIYIDVETLALARFMTENEVYKLTADR